MRTPNFITSIATIVPKYPAILVGIAALSMLASIGADRLIGGRFAEFVGTVQVICILGNLFLLFTYLLFRPYSPRVISVLEFWPVAALRVTLFIAAAVIAIFCIAHIAIGMLIDIS